MAIRTRRALYWIAAGGIAVATACMGTKSSTTQLSTAPVPPRAMKTMIVFAARLDAVHRRAVEDGLVVALAEREVAAQPSHQLFPSLPPERANAQAAVRAAGFDGILVVALKGIREDSTLIPEYERDFWSAYWAPDRDYWSRGSASSGEAMTVQSTLWDTRRADKLVFALYDEMVGPAANRDFVRIVANSVVSSLDKAKLIPEPKER